MKQNEPAYLHNLLASIGLDIPSNLENSLITNVISDSRRITKGSLFLGLPGDHFDGGEFYADAIAAGAGAAAISLKAAKKYPPKNNTSVFVLPEPAEKWAGELAAAFWQMPSSKMSLIGVTGTNGKTTTTHMIEHLCNEAGKATALFGTLVNRWPMHSKTATHTTSCADVLQAQLAAALESGAQVGAMEVSSHSLAQQRVAGCTFSGVIFTNLTQDHLDYHSSMEEYFKTKRLLFREPLLDIRKGMSVVNVDDKWGAILAEELGEKCWRSSLIDNPSILSNVELKITDIKMSSSGVSALLSSPVGEGRFVSPLLGRFNLMNLLQAVGSLIQHGLPLETLLEGVSTFPGVPGRMERIIVNEVDDSTHMPTVLVDYAHTPDGLKNALIAARGIVTGELVCVFGCGGDRDRGKRSQMGSIASQYADRLIITSDNPRTEIPQQIINDIVSGIANVDMTTVEIDRDVAIDYAIDSSSKGDVVLIAGKGHEDYQIIGADRIYFDDRVKARIALQKKVN